MNDSVLLQYDRIFHPQSVQQPARRAPEQAGDERKAPVYVYTEQIIFRINVALATQRPLLVRGPSGTGKSSLAKNAADALGWRFYEKVITSRTQAHELLWEVDLLRRLHDAQRREGEFRGDYTPYIEPGVLWWAFDRNSARQRGADRGQAGIDPVDDPCAWVDHPRAVVLVDEIDKADPDVPNSLLVPLGSLQFQVKETGAEVSTDKANAPLVFITTNNERELPSAFLRRCIELKLEYPTRRRLVEIAGAHFPHLATADVWQIADTLVGPESNDNRDEAVDVSPAEFIDTVRAYDDLKLSIDSPEWRELAAATVWKHGRTRGSL
jgi:MoxR-like ATPase